jgi:hypothetical protein
MNAVANIARCPTLGCQGLVVIGWHKKHLDSTGENWLFNCNSCGQEFAIPVNHSQMETLSNEWIAEHYPAHLEPCVLRRGPQ